MSAFRVCKRRMMAWSLAGPVLAVASGYLAGTIPSADIASRLLTGGRVNLRQSGSGNPGGLNAAMILGTRAGLAVMAADIGKGAMASGIGRAIGGTIGANLGGTAAVVGHCFPIWQHFRGGKGVAASVGQCLATFPAYLPIDLAVAAGTASRITGRRAFTATAASSVCWVAGGLLWWRRRWPNLWGPPPTAMLPFASALSSAVILYKFATARPPAAAPVSPDAPNSPNPDPLGRPCDESIPE